MGKDRYFGYEMADPMTYSLLKEFAAENRRKPTEAEYILWDYLKGKFYGTHFRRQHIIRQYIADFACLSHKLIIELDGGYHQLPDQKICDEERTRLLESNGFYVLRFTNEEVIGDTEEVLNKIKNTSLMNEHSITDIKSPLPLGGSGGRLSIGILGAAGYTGGELIRVLLNHPEAEIVFANSESNAGNLVSDVHEGLIGECELQFTCNYDFDNVDVVFFCFGHGKSEQFLKEHTIPENVKIIDLAQNFRIKGDHDYVYGLPEINKADIAKAQHVANPGCFATAIQLALLPAANLNLLKEDVSVNAITGSTGAGQKPGATTHFSWRVDNLSIYKPFQHQHIAEIRQSLAQVQGYLDADIDFIPYRGNFARGIFCTAVVKTPAPIDDIIEAYKDFYADAAFTHYSDKPIDMKQVVNTNKALVHVEKYGNKLLITSCIDNLLKGAVGQAVQNMNIMFGIDETAGLRLKASAF